MASMADAASAALTARRLKSMTQHTPSGAIVEARHQEVEDAT
jgi:hypothetical protein